ncbi:hypothetical protein [Rhodococcus pyridinivorans]|uniref:hypothetical protein n=1 Tax=Rhodococcus pyridinivorans TaxID=103816 RepID=UPI0039B3D1E4
MSIPVPATAQEIAAPYTPVSLANREGSWKTPAPTIEPTTIAVIAGRPNLPVAFVALTVAVFSVMISRSILPAAHVSRIR